MCKKLSIILTGLILTGSAYAKTIDVNKYPHQTKDIVNKVEQKAESDFKTDMNQKKDFMLKQYADVKGALQEFIQRIIIINKVYPTAPKRVSEYLKDSKDGMLKKINNLEKQLQKFHGDKIVLNVQFEEKVFLGNLKAAKMLKMEIKKDIALNNFVPARINMNIFADEIDEHIYFATKQNILKYLKQLKELAKKGDAYKFLVVAADLINSINQQLIIYPYPLIKTAALIDAVQQMIEHKKVDKEKALNLLREAQYQIELAEVFGYLPYHSSVKVKLEHKIKELKDAINKNQNGVSLISKIKELFEKLKESSNKKINTERNK